MSSLRPLYHSFAWAYDAIVDRPRGPGAEAVAAILSERGVDRGALVIDAGCGTGGHANTLATRGFSVVGIDRSPELIEHARAKNGNARYEVGDLRTWRPDAPAGAVLCRGVLNDLLGDDERQAALRGLAQMLSPGGVLVGDVREWSATAARYADRGLVERSVQTARGPITFRAEATLLPEARILRLHETISLGDLEEAFAFAMRPWLRDELDLGLREAGFGEVELSEGERMLAIATLAG